MGNGSRVKRKKKGAWNGKQARAVADVEMKKRGYATMLAAAGILGVSVGTLYNQRSQGKIPEEALFKHRSGGMYISEDWAKDQASLPGDAA